ncbi:MAG: hypothetical protein LBP22_02650 [Deltaproteobacteria bacterium]|jgi:hypothetical protein|nr:hypothetical protein [Deltaproteobacteria bacterium]
MKVSKFLCLLSALGLVFFISACGVKTHPYPESATLPGPVRNLAQSQDDRSQLWLTWLSPLFNAAGRPLRSIDHFEVWGADYEKRGFCDGCPVSYRKLAEVYMKPPAPGLNINEGPYQWVTTVKPDRVYRFKVAGFSGRGAVNQDSWEEITVWGQKNPGGLMNFRAVSDDLAVRLSWPEPRGEISVEVQKQSPGGDWQVLDLTGSQPGAVTDLDVVYGQTYIYRARLTAREGQSSVPGPFTSEIRVRVEDLLPPRPIGFLDASPAPNGVSLRWENLSLEESIAGYRVYRRRAQDSGFILISGLIKTNTYLDTGIMPEETVFYRVTSVDNSPSANESRPSPEVSVLTVNQTEPEPVRPEVVDPGL